MTATVRGPARESDGAPGGLAARRAPTVGRRLRDAAVHSWRPLLVMVVLFAIWWLVGHFRVIAPYLVRSPGRVAQVMGDQAGYLWDNTLTTTWETGLVRPSEGTTTLLGTVVAGPRPDIGFVFQRAALLEWRSARRNILLQAEMRRMARAEATTRADELIAMTGLTGFEHALPHELSGGMQQRVSLCRALLHRPPVLLMDEPFGALDALTREQMNVELHRIWRETGTTVLFVTHSIAEAAYLASRVVVLSPRPGRVLEVVDVDLPRDRDYAATMRSDEFGEATARIRGLLGARTDDQVRRQDSGQD